MAENFDFERDFENVVSVDELLDYFFEEAFKPAYFESKQEAIEARSGIASDEKVVGLFRSFMEGWKSGGNENPPEEEVIPELLVRYHKIVASSRAQ